MTDSPTTSQKGTVDVDDLSHSSENDTTSDVLYSEEERDEVKEVYKMSANDTRRVQIWRLAVTAVLLCTAVAVTFTTWKFLKDEEMGNFEVAFEKFSRTVGDAAIAQQEKIREAMTSMSHIMSTYAVTQNLTWPFVQLPHFEVYASDRRIQGNLEMINVWNRVPDEKKDDYLDWVTATYHSMVLESHLLESGNFDRLNPDWSSYHPYFTQAGPEGFVEDIERDEYWGSYHFSPPPATFGLANWNIASLPPFGAAIEAILQLRNETVFVEVMPYKSADISMTKEDHAAMHSQLKNSAIEHPHTFGVHPVHLDASDYNSEIVAYVGSGVALDRALLDLLPEGVGGIICVIKNNFNQTYTYQIDGHDALFLGAEDIHESNFDSYAVKVDLALHTHPDFKTATGNCQYEMTIYPSSVFKSQYDSNTPEVFAAVVATTFVLVAIVFYVYDIFVQKRNENLVAKAAQSNALVSSLFPDAIRDRLMEEKAEEAANKSKKKGNLKAFLNDGKSDAGANNKPLADLFLETTVLFADISGFTAWSSVREPTQVFTLLETIYAAFDEIAKRRKIFKVETVGDCYVAVCGLPEPRADHAAAMARFSQDILSRMRIVTKELELRLGPGTADLALRMGLHSGQVTAGVLRGERARFQLFGDTVNTASRMESTSQRGRIQCSKETAALLQKAGKDAWLEPRNDRVCAKGLGELETFWVNVTGLRAGSVRSAVSASSGALGNELPAKTAYKKSLPGLDESMYRLIDWNVETLLRLLKQVVAFRESTSSSRRARVSYKDSSDLECRETPLEEVREIIALPEFDGKAAIKQKDPEKVEIPEDVVQQLHLLVSKIAAMYNANPFHNFSHASHVVMSVTKLMSRIVAPSHLEDLDNENAAATLHDHTYGITSDPLTQFACAFSALIHDVDHTGASNAQLVKEGVPIAAKYHERSVAEQNSLDLSWNLLMEPDYAKLRAFLFPTPAELVRFRQLVVNSVMATDIVDTEMKTLRNNRWDKAFKKGDEANHVDENPRDEVNRKATIVIEHIIQASDISHTMQHWHVYRKWNQNLFEELYVAYLNGRMEKDPAEFWFKGEIGFFDFYIIPLTKKLKDCGVFGVSSDEYLNYALKNKEEWIAKGESVVASMIEEVRAKYGTKDEGNVDSETPAPQPVKAKEVDC